MLAPARYSTSTRKWLPHMDGSDSTSNLVPVFPPGVIYHFRRPRVGGEHSREVAACPSSRQHRKVAVRRLGLSSRSRAERMSRQITRDARMVWTAAPSSPMTTIPRAATANMRLSFCPLRWRPSTQLRCPGRTPAWPYPAPPGQE